jgi:hypothetical protein
MPDGMMGGMPPQGMGAPAPAPQPDIVGQLYDAIDQVAQQLGAPTDQLIMALAKKSVAMGAAQAPPQSPAAPRPVPPMFAGGGAPPSPYTR